MPANGTTPLKETDSGELLIRMGLWRVQVVYSADPSQPSTTTNSHSYSESILRVDDQLFQLNYFYNGTVSDPDPNTDTNLYKGAAELVISPQGDEIKVSGHYWTNRSWVQGLNAAGELRLQKLD